MYVQQPCITIILSSLVRVSVIFYVKFITIKLLVCIRTLIYMYFCPLATLPSHWYEYCIFIRYNENVGMYENCVILLHSFGTFARNIVYYRPLYVNDISLLICDVDLWLCLPCRL